jgi:DNA polymerase delta subunit 2
MYFARLAAIKPAVEAAATEAWAEFEIGGEPVYHVERVLDVRQGQLCWISGTVFMEMQLKPNVLDDLEKDYWIAAPPPRQKFLGPDGQPLIMLEDESGRLRLTGKFLATQLLVTGAIIAVMGTENANGEFEVIDVKFPDLPRQPARWEEMESMAALNKQKVTEQKSKGGKIALVSGLGISAAGNEALMLDLLLEYLLGDSTSGDVQAQAANISRLVIVGNSFAQAAPIPPREESTSQKESQRYGHDRVETYNPAPSENLDIFLSSLLPSIPITLIPGATDPTNVAIPQQPLHPALFPRSRAYAQLPTQEDAPPSWFDSVTNPWEGEVDGWRMLGTGGQPIDDIFKYVDTDDRLDMMEHVLRWRCNAPTAPDTLCKLLTSSK